MNLHLMTIVREGGAECDGFEPVQEYTDCLYNLDHFMC